MKNFSENIRIFRFFQSAEILGIRSKWHFDLILMKKLKKNWKNFSKNFWKIFGKRKDFPKTSKYSDCAENRREWSKWHSELIPWIWTKSEYLEIFGKFSGNRRIFLKFQSTLIVNNRCCCQLQLYYGFNGIDYESFKLSLFIIMIIITSMCNVSIYST